MTSRAKYVVAAGGDLGPSKKICPLAENYIRKELKRSCSQQAGFREENYEDWPQAVSQGQRTKLETRASRFPVLWQVTRIWAGRSKQLLGPKNAKIANGDIELMVQALTTQATPRGARKKKQDAVKKFLLILAAHRSDQQRNSAGISQGIGEQLARKTLEAEEIKGAASEILASSIESRFEKPALAWGKNPQGRGITAYGAANRVENFDKKTEAGTANGPSGKKRDKRCDRTDTPREKYGSLTIRWTALADLRPASLDSGKEVGGT